MNLQYNKLYQSLKKVHGEWHAGHVEWGYYWNYLKFYEDGTFIYMSTDGDDPNQINHWFNKDAENIVHGTFKFLKSPQIQLVYPNNIQVDAGMVKDDKILVQGKLDWEIFTPLAN